MRHLFLGLLGLFLSYCLSSKALAQLSASPNQHGTFTTQGVPWSVYTDNQDRTYIMGDFNLPYQGAVYSKVIRLTATGSIDPSFQLDPTIANNFHLVHGMVSDGAEGFYLYGRVYNNSNFPVQGLPFAHITQEGKVVEGFGTAQYIIAHSYISYVLPTEGGVYATIKMNGNLAEDQSQASHPFDLIKFSPDGSSYEVIASLTDEFLLHKIFEGSTTETLSDGRLLIAAKHLFLANPTSGLVDSLHVNGTAYETVAAGDGIWVYGKFSSVSGHATTNLARLNPDGSVDTDYTFSGLSEILSLEETSTGQLMVLSLDFDNTAGILSRLQADGSMDETYPAITVPMFPSIFNAMTINSADEVIISSVAQRDGETVNLFGYDAAGNSLNPALREMENIYPVHQVLAAHGNTYIRGDFMRHNGEELSEFNQLIKLNADGNQDPNFVAQAPEFFFRASIYTAYPLGTNKLLITNGNVGTATTPVFFAISAETGALVDDFTSPLIGGQDFRSVVSWQGGFLYVDLYGNWGAYTETGATDPSVTNTINEELSGGTIYDMQTSPDGQHLFVSLTDGIQESKILRVSSDGTTTVGTLGSRNDRLYGFRIKPAGADKVWIVTPQDFVALPEDGNGTTGAKFGLFDIVNGTMEWSQLDANVPITDEVAPSLWASMGDAGFIFNRFRGSTLYFLNRQQQIEELFTLPGINFRSLTTLPDGRVRVLGDFTTWEGELTSGEVVLSPELLAPTNLSSEVSTTDSTRHLRVQWSNPNLMAEGYKVYLAEDGSSPRLVGNRAADNSVLSFDITDYTPGAKATISLEAYNQSISSAPASIELAATITDLAENHPQQTLVYPNPGKGRFVIAPNASNTHSATVRVLSPAGKEVYSGETHPGQAHLFELQAPPGIYWLMIETPVSRGSTMLVIEE